MTSDKRKGRGTRRRGAVPLHPAGARPPAHHGFRRHRGTTKRGLRNAFSRRAVLPLRHIGTNLRFQNDWIYIINRGLPPSNFPLRPSPSRYPQPSACRLARAQSVITQADCEIALNWKSLPVSLERSTNKMLPSFLLSLLPHCVYVGDVKWCMRFACEEERMYERMNARQVWHRGGACAKAAQTRQS